jgi:thioredoxin 1
MIELNAEQLKNKINSGEKFVVDFYATWCGPCKYFSKILEEHSDKFGVPVYKFDIETDRDMSVKYNIRSVPTLKLFNEGNPIKTHLGILSESEFNKFSNS